MEDIQIFLEWQEPKLANEQNMEHISVIQMPKFKHSRVQNSS
jgi:hypothetical protein